MPRPLLTVTGVSKSYGTQEVLRDISFQVHEGQKIALIGRNGAGKSTLLKVLLGQIDPDIGSSQFYGWTRVGVVHQNEVLPGDVATLAYLENGSEKPEWEVKKLARKFGLHDAQLELPPAALSGGYQMRVKLALMFLKEPNLLFLDEPVNYLDLQTLLLLEGVLKSYRGTFILVAHDRTFLEETCTEVFEIERGVLTSYAGKVSEFLEWKAETRDRQLRTNKKLAREMKHHQQFVDRFGAKASLATRAQSKVKHISKLRSKIVHINADLATTRIKIHAPHIHPGTALRVEDLTVGYGDKVIASDIRFEINRGDKVVITGENGKGKSTLLKTLVGAIPPLGGGFKWWKHANIGYYDQLTSSALRDRDTVLEHLTASAPHATSAEQILMMAGNFLFVGKDLDKRVEVLSGGERARLALAGVLLKEHTVLVLDEPSNHMDVETAEGLAIALKNYGGTVIFVSHARTFVSELAERVIEVRDGGAKEFLGGYDDYVAYLEDLARIDLPVEKDMDAALKEADRAKRQEQFAESKRIKREIALLEAKIQTLEKEKSSILRYFFDNPLDYSPEKSQRLKEIEGELEPLERSWTSLSESLESRD